MANVESKYSRFTPEQLEDAPLVIRSNITDEEILSTANDLVAESYLKFADTLTVDEVKETIVYDKFLREGYAVPLHTFITNPVTHRPELAATVRYVRLPHYDETGIETLEIDELMDWDTTEDVNKIGELSRLAVARPYRNISGLLLTGMTKKVFDIAREEGKNELDIVAPPNILDLYHQGGLHPQPIPSRLRWDNPDARVIFERFPKYWQRKGNLPEVYRFPLNPTNDSVK